MVQLVAGSILVLIGAYVFHRYPMKKDTKSIVLGALFVVIAVVLKRLSIMIPLFGVPALKIGFEIIPMMLVGMILAPGYSYLVGLAIDMIGLIITPTEFPFLGFTLNSVLITTVPSIMLDTMKRMQTKTLERFLCFLMSGIVGFISIYILLLDSVMVSDKTIVMNAFYKGVIIGIVLALSIILWQVIRYMKKRVHQDHLAMLYIWIMVVIVVETGVTFILIPYWLQVMYGIPFMVSLFVRVVKQCVIIPLDIMIGYQLLRALRKF
jgi:ECF transporter S component (folate family)